MAPATSAPRSAATPQGAVSNEFERMITSTETIADNTILPVAMRIDPIRSPKAIGFRIGNPPCKFRFLLRRWGD